MEQIMESTEEVEQGLDDIIEDLNDYIFDRYMVVTSNGTELTPSWWSKTLEARGIIRSANAIESMVYRRRKAADQDKPAHAPAPTANDKSALRSGRSVIRRYPEMADELVRDPEAAQAVEEALIRKRASQPINIPNPDDVGRRAAASMTRAMGDDPVYEDLASAHKLILEAAANYVEQGTQDEERVRIKLQHIRETIDGFGSGFNEADRKLAEELGVKL